MESTSRGDGQRRAPVGARPRGNSGAEMLTNVNLRRLDLSAKKRAVEFESGGQTQTVEARFLLVNFGLNVLAKVLGCKSYTPDSTNEGSVFKINMLLHRLPKLKATQIMRPRMRFAVPFASTKAMSR